VGDKLKKKHSIAGRIEMDAATVLTNTRDLAVQFASERRERQQRRHLDSADFNRLCAWAGTLIKGLGGKITRRIDAGSTKPGIT
jgi:hypothetical protein